MSTQVAETLKALDIVTSVVTIAKKIAVTSGVILHFYTIVTSRRNLAFLYYCYERPLLAYGESISTGSRACGPSLIKKKLDAPA